MTTPESPSFKIVGGDGREYGPIDLAALQQWTREGRLRADTRVWDSRNGAWQTAAQVPELAAVIGAAAPPPAAVSVEVLPPLPPAGQPAPSDAVATPSIFMMVVGCVSLALALVSAALNMLGTRIAGLQPDAPEELINALSGTLGLVLNSVSILTNVVIIIGAMKMKSFSSHGWAMTAAILSLLPCNGCCCGLGLAAGIWSLMVLNNPSVKAAFERR